MNTYNGMSKETMKSRIENACKKYENCSDGCPLFTNGCKYVRDNGFAGVLATYLKMFPDEREVDATQCANKDSVNHPSHYQGKHECIDEMVELFGVDAVIGFCKCNVYKYRYRADRKNGNEDIKKAEWYMDKLVELQGGKDE